ncbi:hypothetical protein P9B03_07980 [Metasolibacillus meyeri]|uniref:Uncharacterized protein n=1 Tax=Metasolibacillus meyeri TaxID=1071052 RepID=A0AAW9NPJ5_9BACL|nr:hypothetical protein [Metasolibacillus meyeri]MEC1178416.1 hypothetical protein [Metasolibacillus meyeri]
MMLVTQSLPQDVATTEFFFLSRELGTPFDSIPFLTFIPPLMVVGDFCICHYAFDTKNNAAVALLSRRKHCCCRFTFAQKTLLNQVKYLPNRVVAKNVSQNKFADTFFCIIPAFMKREFANFYKLDMVFKNPLA